MLFLCKTTAVIIKLPFILFTVLMAILIIGKHWTNIQRLREGTESKFSFKKSVKSTKTNSQDEK